MARGLDHLVIGVRDLDAAGAFYGRLGFTVGARNRHPWGTHNRIVQFPGCFLELITVGEPELIEPQSPGHLSFGAFVRDALARGEGMSMLVLESLDAAADQAQFAANGIGGFASFFFEREASRPDGSTARVAFTLSFARDPLAPHCGFFTCQQHEPQNFWNPAFQVHPNGALGLASATIAAVDPARHAAFLAAFTGADAREPGPGQLDLALPRGAIRVTADDAGPETRFTAFSVTVPDIEALGRRLGDNGISHAHHDGRIVVPAAAALGVEITFQAA